MVVQENRDLFWKMLEAEHPQAESFCRRLAGHGDDWQDIYHDAIIQAQDKFSHLRNHESFKGWLYRIIINRFKSKRRLNWWRNKVTITENISETIAGPLEEPAALARLSLEKALSSLTPDDRSLMILYELQGWAISEISQMYGKPDGTIKSRLARARQKMRRMIIDDLPNEQLENSNKEAYYAMPRSEP